MKEMGSCVGEMGSCVVQPVCCMVEAVCCVGEMVVCYQDSQRSIQEFGLALVALACTGAQHLYGIETVMSRLGESDYQMPCGRRGCVAFVVRSVLLGNGADLSVEHLVY